MTFMKLLFLSLLGMTDPAPCTSAATPPTAQHQITQQSGPVNLTLLRLLGMNETGPCAAEMTRQSTTQTPLPQGNEPLDLIKIGGTSPKPINN